MQRQSKFNMKGLETIVSIEEKDGFIPLGRRYQRPQRAGCVASIVVALRQHQILTFPLIDNGSAAVVDHQNVSSIF